VKFPYTLLKVNDPTPVPTDPDLVPLLSVICIELIKVALSTWMYTSASDIAEFAAVPLNWLQDVLGKLVDANTINPALGFAVTRFLYWRLTYLSLGVAVKVPHRFQLFVEDTVMLGVMEGVMLIVTLTVGLGVLVGVTLIVGTGVEDIVTVGVSDKNGVSDMVGVIEGSGVRDIVWLIVGVMLTVAVEVGVSEGVLVTVLVGVTLLVTVMVGVMLGDGLGIM
jgi:hypothetical protein